MHKTKEDYGTYAQDEDPDTNARVHAGHQGAAQGPDAVSACRFHGYCRSHSSEFHRPHFFTLARSLSRALSFSLPFFYLTHHLHTHEHTQASMISVLKLLLSQTDPSMHPQRHYTGNTCITPVIRAVHRKYVHYTGNTCSTQVIRASHRYYVHCTGNTCNTPEIRALHR